MSNSIQGFFFERVRSSSNDRKELVIQGYAIDGLFNGLKPRAAIVVGGRTVKTLKCRVEAEKLPPIKMRRRHGDTISYMGFVYVEMEDISEETLKQYGYNAGFVVVFENQQKDRFIIYRNNLGKVYRILREYNFNIDLSYVEDGHTIIKGWYAGGGNTKLKLSDENQTPLEYDIKYLVRDDVIMEYPECSDDLRPGFEMKLNGEYKKLRFAISDGNKKGAKIVKPGKSDDENSKMNVLSRYSEKVARNLKNYGVRETVSKIRVRMSPSYVNLNRHYEKWLKSISPGTSELQIQRASQKTFAYRPFFSILVPLYETDEKFLDELIRSVQAQTYNRWELCFSDGSKSPDRLRNIIDKYDDKRIRYTAELPGPLGISSNTNQAFSIARGEFIVLGDHDDLISPDALFECVRAMNNHITENGFDTELDVIYTDEDKTNSNAKKRFEPNIKPDFNVEYLESCNYITHMFVVRKTLVDEVGLFDDTYNGAQDYDFILRCTEKARKIHHITKIVYSWRINDTSTAGNPEAKMYAYDAGVKALQAHYDRVGIKAKAQIGDHLGYYSTEYELPEDTFTYIVVSDADEEEKYKTTIDSIKAKSNYQNIDFIRTRAGGNPSLSRQLNKAMENIRKDVRSKGLEAEKVYVCFIEAGITMMGENGISGMIGYLANRPEAGAIGGKMYAVGGSLNHAGVILNMGELEGWMFMRHSKYDDKYFNYCAYSALRRGIVLFRLTDLNEYGEFPMKYSGEHAIVDYTYKMTLDGKRCIYDANAEFQLKPQRGKDADTCFESINSKLKEFGMFLKEHTEVIDNGDVYYGNSIRKIEE